MIFLTFYYKQIILYCVQIKIVGYYQLENHFPLSSSIERELLEFQD